MAFEEMIEKDEQNTAQALSLIHNNIYDDYGMAPEDTDGVSVFIFGRRYEDIQRRVSTICSYA